MASVSLTDLQNYIELAEQQGDAAGAERMRRRLLSAQQERLQSMPSENFAQGASYLQRALVGGSQPQDRLATLRNTYPSAVGIGDDNYAFYDTDNENRPTLYNPEGFDFGDVAEYGREITQTAAAIPATLAAAPTGPAALAVPAVASTTAGLLYDQAMSQLGQEDTRSLPQYATDKATEFGLELIPWDRFMGAGWKYVHPKFNNFMSNTNSRIQEVAKKYDVRPTFGQAGNEFLGMLDAGMQKTILTRNAWVKSAQEMMDGVAGIVDTFHFKLTGQMDDTGRAFRSNPVDAGDRLIASAKEYERNFYEHSEANYNILGNLIPKGTRVETPKLKEYLEKLSESVEGEPELAQTKVHPYIKPLLEKYASGNIDIDYHFLKKLRTDLGRTIRGREAMAGNIGGSPFTYADQVELYKILTDDMFDAARRISPEAGAAAEEANDYHRAGMEVIDKIIKKHLKNNDGSFKTGTEAFNRMKTLVQDPDKTKAVAESGVFREGDTEEFVSAFYDEKGMGLARQANQSEDGTRASLNTVLTETSNTNRGMLDRSRDILVSGEPLEILKDLRAFADVNKGVEQFVNQSNTATANIMAASAATLSTGAAQALQGNEAAAFTGLLALGVPYLASKGLNSRWFVDWLMSAPKELRQTLPDQMRSRADVAQLWDATKPTHKEWLNSGIRIASSKGVSPDFIRAVFENEHLALPQQGALEEKD